MMFEKHLFISYAHVDNKTTPDDEQGWVSRFHKYLECYLSTNIGEEAKIWRDERLRGNDIFANEIVKQFPGTAVLISVLSPRYFESPWCLKEIHEFCKVAEQNGGLIVDDKARVLRVMLRPIPADQMGQMPSVLVEATGYEFYQEAEGKRVLPLDPVFGTGEAYRRNIYFLAEDVAEVIKRLEKLGHRKAAPPVEKAASKPTIYLAECSYDRWEDREKIRGELRTRGYTVLPDQLVQLPDREMDYVAEVRRLLDQCQFSIHLVGRFHGKVPDGPGDKSVVQLQNELAARKSEEGALQRVIWLPEGTRSDHAEQQAFLEALQRLAELQRGADLITGDLEDLKGAIRNTLKRLEEARPQEGVAAEAGPRKIYVICVERDIEEAALPLLEYLTGQGFDVDLPVFTGSATEVREANEAKAGSCDAVILFFGHGDGAWKFHQQSELKRIQGSQRNQALLPQFSYLAGPATADKRVALLKKELNLINGLEGFSEAAMGAFLRAIHPH